MARLWAICLAAAMVACSGKKTAPIGPAGSGGTAGGGTGAGGAAGATATATFPLKVSASKRYLTGQNGAPFLIAGDAPQCLTARLSIADMGTFFSMRAQQGFNAAWVNAVCNTY